MTPKDRAAFVTNLCNSVRDQVVSRTPDMPDAWDGHELRELLADLFAGERSSVLQDKRNGRYRDFARMREYKQLDRRRA